jgi:serine/threonine-protein kinase RsbW
MQPTYSGKPITITKSRMGKIEDCIEEVVLLAETFKSSSGTRLCIRHYEDETIRCIEQISREIENAGYEGNTKMEAHLLTAESIYNAFEHGKGEIEIQYSCDKDTFRIAVIDQGEGFDTKNIPDPTLPENILKDTGRGLFLIKNYASELRFTKKGNGVGIVKKIKT